MSKFESAILFFLLGYMAFSVANLIYSYFRR